MAADKTPPATRDSPIKGPDSPAKQPAKNLTNSDPPLKTIKPAKSRVVQKSKAPTNPDRKQRVTTLTPYEPSMGDIVTPADVQFIASSRTVNRYIRGDLILPASLDEVELATSIDIFNEMLLDPTIATIRLWTNANVLADGLTFEAKAFQPPQGEEDVNEVDAMETEWSKRYITAAYDRLQYTDRDIMMILWDLLDGARIPHKIAEQTFDTQKYGEFAGYPGIKSLRTKPRENYNLVYDTYNMFRGVVAVVPGGSLAKWSGFIFDVSVLPNAIAAEKLTMFMGDDRDGIPRSLYSGAYAPWARMMSIYADLMDTSRNAAGGKQTVILGDKAGQTFIDPVTGNKQTAEERTNAALANNGNNGTLVLMAGAEHLVFYPQPGALASFIEAIKMCKREIASALTTQEKSIFEGEHGSGLSEETAGDDAQPVIELLKSRLCIALNRLSFTLLSLAKGEEYAMRYCPSASMKRGDIQDFAPSATAYAAMAKSESFTPSQIPDLAKIVGMKAPNAAELEALTKAWFAKMEFATKPPEPVVAPKAKQA